MRTVILKKSTIEKENSIVSGSIDSCDSRTLLHSWLKPRMWKTSFAGAWELAQYCTVGIISFEMRHTFFKRAKRAKYFRYLRHLFGFLWNFAAFCGVNHVWNCFCVFCPLCTERPFRAISFRIPSCWDFLAASKTTAFTFTTNLSFGRRNSRLGMWYANLKQQTLVTVSVNAMTFNWTGRNSTTIVLLAVARN